jgi:hypothetical protein
VVSEVLALVGVWCRLADQGLIKESAAASDRWMIVLASDPSDDD